MHMEAEKGTFMDPRNRPRRGSALTAAIVVIFMLLVVVLALYQYEGMARQTYMTEEATLRFREGSRFALQQQIVGTAAPSDLTVIASVSNVTPSNTVSLPSQF